MRNLTVRGQAMLGAVALGAVIVLVVRLSKKAQRRKREHDAAVATLRESGEFFLPSVEADPAKITLS